ncbi:Exosortase [Sphingomonas antarctica]|uniref:exosortase n=1 Tax=Sphingomonas antarctica TaxID=2040274 RepID=UPI0039ED3E53
MDTVAARRPPGFDTVVARWPLAIGLAALIIPTLIILATGLWLFFSQKDVIREHRRPGSLLVAIPVGLFGALCYIAGQAFGFLVIQVGATILICETIFYLFVGGEVCRRLWFALLYLYFVAPLPTWFQDRLTGSLKEWVSASVTHILSGAGIPVVREGVVMYVAQYQLLVEDACSGLNSLTSLFAIGLFYIYLLHQASVRYALFLSALIFPIAIFANMIRVSILVLLTYFWSDQVAQGFLHQFAGMVTFITALLTIMLIDSALQSVMARRQAGGAIARPA